tara:strand:+ start:601 stop:1065 length:465 start_codon:yes stop_codon:yes gene_type:complete
LENKLNISFTGEYHNSLDQKNRLNIPAKFRKALNPINDKTFVLTRGFDPCLILYPLNDWRQVELQLGKLSSIKNKNRNFVRSITRYATTVQYDAQGRIQISDTLMQYSNIDKDAIVIGLINKIEIWAPSMLSNQDLDNNLNNENFDDLANEINF